MRIVQEIVHPDCRISIFAWNNRYLIKLEQGLMEQTFKIDQFDVTSEADIPLLIDEEFIQQALKRFEEMGQSLHEARLRLSH